MSSGSPWAHHAHLIRERASKSPSPWELELGASLLHMGATGGGGTGKDRGTGCSRKGAGSAAGGQRGPPTEEEPGRGRGWSCPRGSSGHTHVPGFSVCGGSAPPQETCASSSRPMVLAPSLVLPRSPKTTVRDQECFVFLLRVSDLSQRCFCSRVPDLGASSLEPQGRASVASPGLSPRGPSRRGLGGELLHPPPCPRPRSVPSELAVTGAQQAAHLPPVTAGNSRKV